MCVKRKANKPRLCDLWLCSCLQCKRKCHSNQIRSQHRNFHSSRLWNVNIHPRLSQHRGAASGQTWDVVASNKHQCDVTYSLSQHTLEALLMVFDVQPLQKHEAANPLQPTGHLTHKSLILFSLVLVGSPHTTLPWDSRLRYDHLSECFRQQNNVYCTVSYMDT